ncbi:hypothetical protein BDF19DRAFT_416890 [Syncephalis fuscata]|nr:hypothetical protein BDF19DRAFT_416890 [Syncephalis fuscata]
MLLLLLLLLLVGINPVCSYVDELSINKIFANMRQVYKLSDLSDIPRNEFNEFGRSSVSINFAFKCVNGVCRTTGVDGVKPITIACGNDKQSNPNDRSLQVYRSLMSFSLARLGLSLANNLIVRPVDYFKLEDGTCYIIPEICKWTLEQNKLAFDALPKGLKNTRKESAIEQFYEGINSLHSYGWLYDLQPENICIGNDMQIVLYNYKNPQPPKTAVNSKKDYEHEVRSKIDSMVNSIVNNYFRI